MITRYKDFIDESTNLKPEDFGIKEYEWNNGLLDVKNSVDLSGKKLKGIEILELPFNFGNIKGNFYCYNNRLTTLKGSPKEVYGDFDCADNKLLTSLEFCPHFVKGDFICSDNQITSLEDYPLCIIDRNMIVIDKDGTTLDYEIFDIIQILIKENEELFIPLLDNKIAFHQMIMRLDKSMIEYYKTIPTPSKNSSLLL